MANELSGKQHARVVEQWEQAQRNEDELALNKLRADRFQPQAEEPADEPRDEDFDVFEDVAVLDIEDFDKAPELATVADAADKDLDEVPSPAQVEANKEAAVVDSPDPERDARENERAAQQNANTEAVTPIIEDAVDEAEKRDDVS